MDSLLQAAHNAAVVERIEALAADRSPQWGKMTVAQMLVHCQLPFQLAADELKLKRGIISFLIGGFAKKKFVTGDSPFGKNSPTDPTFIIKGERDFAREQAALIELVKRFSETGPVTQDPHPFFGPMVREDWDRLLWKHMDHHLRQFAV